MAPETVENDIKTVDIADETVLTPSVEAEKDPAAELNIGIDAQEAEIPAEHGGKAKKGLSKLAVAVIVALSAVILTTVILLIFMLGGGSSAYTAEDIGLYNAVAAEKDGVTADISGLFTDGFSIELRSRGKCKINLNGELISGKWGCTNGLVTVSGGGVTYTGYVADGVMLLQNVMNENLSLTLKTDAAAALISADRAGKYYISSFSVNGQVYEGDMIESAGFGEWYIELDKNGSGSALMFSTTESELVWTNDSIKTVSGLILPYAYEEGVIMLDYPGMSAVTFKNDAARDPFTDEGLAGTLKTETLETGSLWSGELTITDHQGDGSISDGVTPVYGFLCRDSGGGSFFELYETPTRSGTPIMSYWVEINDTILVPLVGEFDGWLFDYWLTANDAEAFKLTLVNSSLNLKYLYNWNGESCNVDISLAYAGKI